MKKKKESKTISKFLALSFRVENMGGGSGSLNAGWGEKLGLGHVE